MSNNENELDQRCANFTNINPEIVRNLQNFFHTHNHLIHLFKYAMEFMPTDDYKIIIKADKVPVGDHKKRYSVPNKSDIAIVMTDGETNARDIVLHKRNAELQRVRETHRSYDALQYPILFWQDDDGYHFNILQNNSTKKVTATTHY